MQLGCKHDASPVPFQGRDNSYPSSQEDNDMVPPSASCGWSTDTPCCHLQYVLDNIQQEGDTVYLNQMSGDKHFEINKTLEIQVKVRKSFILTSLKPATMSLEEDYIKEIDKVKIQFTNNCSEPCSLKIHQSHFTYSSLMINDLDVFIKDAQFKDSFIIAGATSENHGYGNIRIKETIFKNDFHVGMSKTRNLFCVQVMGKWNLVELLRSIFQGDRKSQVSGIKVMHANIQTINLIDVQISSMYSAMVIQASGVDVFNVTDSIFLGNRDGIDFGQGVRHTLISGSQMNSTGVWSGGGQLQCHSALKGCPKHFKVADTTFAHNQASGMNCKAAAIFLMSNNHNIPLLLSNNEMFEKGDATIYPIKVEKSVFYGNTIKNCSVHELEHFENGGGAIAVFGLQLGVKIVASIFIRNEAGKGAGLYIGLSGRGFHDDSQTYAPGLIGSSKILIDTCIFNENIAMFGGGLMTEFKDSTLETDSTLSTLIHNSSFIRNNASYRGAGACLHYSSVYLYHGAAVIIKFSHIHFERNTFFNTKWSGNGGGMSVEFISLFLMFRASVKTLVTNCSFISNTAAVGAGTSVYMESSSVNSSSSFLVQIAGSTFTSNIADYHGAGTNTELKSCSIDSNSSIVLQTVGSTFTSNIGTLVGAGMGIAVKSCTVHSKSLIMLQTNDSVFLSNTVSNGAGIYINVESCIVHSNSSIILRTSDSTFKSNIARHLGAGIFTGITKSSCSTCLTRIHSTSSIMLQTTGSTFTNNTALYGAGIHTQVRSCSVDSNSYFTLLMTDCIFLINTAKKDGAGIHAKLESGAIHSTSSFTIQISGSSFSSNKARKGAGLSVKHFPEDVCVSGEVIVAIAECRFRNNSASNEGGSLHLKVFLIAKIDIKQSVFQSNHAFPGSGLYSENFDVQSCDTAVCEVKLKALVTTHISKCLFIDNINTAILVKSAHRYGTLQITKCSFKNNMCIYSSFAEEIFNEMKLVLSHTTIYKEHNYARTMGIDSQSDAKIKNVTVNTRILRNQRQISIAIFSHYIIQTKGSSLEYQCPAFYQPTLSIAGMTETGAVMVRVTCDACFEGYYTGQTWMVIEPKIDGGYHCHEKQLFNVYGQPSGKNRFCYTKSIGTCIECPHGGNCTAGVVSLPNYWGQLTTANRLEFKRCPAGYCCNQAPCDDIARCAAHREGTLCGRCAHGFTESLLSQECLPDEECDDTWVLALFILWAFCVTWAILFMGELEKFPHKILKRCKQTWCRKTERQANHQRLAQANASDRTSATLPTSQVATAEMKQVGLQVIPKEPILWGLLSTERHENEDQSGHLKYLQIVLYYIQDSALLQVDLALGSKDNVMQKVRKLLLNVSQMPVDLLDLGLKLCPIKGWTPVYKIIAKNGTFPLVLFFIFIIYLIVTSASMCFSNKRQSIRKFWYPKLTAAVIFSVLLSYQQIANTAFSLLYCIQSDDQSILFIDGTINCYQPWQIMVLIFAFNWIVAIIPVLMFLPGLLELRLICVKDFFLACLLPGPMLIYWGYRIHKKKFSVHRAFRTPWQDEALALLQKTFVKTTYKNTFPFCWLGFMKVRRLALVLTFTFVSNLVGRVSLMCFVLVLFLVLHLKTLPYQDAIANEAYTASLLATLSIGLINIMKATCVEFYLDVNKVKHSLETLDTITDTIFVYCPPAFIVLAILAVVWGKIRTSMRNKEAKKEIIQVPIVTEDDL